MGVILFGIIGLVVGFGIGYLRFAAPLQRKITAIERAKLRVESANEGIKQENQQLQTQLLQLDTTYKRRIQELEQSHQSQLEASRDHVFPANEAHIQALNARHQSEILAYQQQIHDLQTALSSAIAPPSDYPLPESSLSSPSHFSGGVSGLVTGLAGAAAGVAAGIGLGDLFSSPEESPPPEEENIADNFSSESPEVETPWGDSGILPENRTEPFPEAPALETSGNESFVEPETFANELAFDDSFSPLLASLEDSQVLPDSPTLIETPALETNWRELDEPSLIELAETTEAVSPDFFALEPDQQWTPPIVPSSEERIETPELNSLDLASLLNESSQENETSTLPVSEENAIAESFHWLENPTLEEDLPNFFAETETDPFSNLFEADTESPDLAFLELLQMEEEPFALGEEHPTRDPLAGLPEMNSASFDWDFGELLPTDDESQNSDFNLSSNEEHHEGLDELFDSLSSLAEEK